MAGEFPPGLGVIHQVEGFHGVEEGEGLDIGLAERRQETLSYFDALGRRERFICWVVDTIAGSHILSEPDNLRQSIASYSLRHEFIANGHSENSSVIQSVRLSDAPSASTRAIDSESEGSPKTK